MKRLILLAAVVGLIATGCEKTEIQNEVNNPIGFSNNIGKQTKAIADGTTTNYFESQPFGVYAYGPTYTENSVEKDNNMMSNVQIAYANSKYSAAGDTKYYWPNYETTLLSFFAYSPYLPSTAVDDDKNLNGTITHSKTAGLTISGYEHKNMYLDFMVSTPVTGATFSKPDGINALGSSDADNAKKGIVPLVFHHQLTQLNFTVNLREVYKGITFTINSITLKNIKNKGTYTYTGVDNVWSDGETGSWTFPNPATTGEYPVFPALTSKYAPIDETAKPLTNTTTNTAELKTQSITVIPQTLEADTQCMEIQYTISGTGVAEENVTKTIYFNTANVEWTTNKKITYTLTIGLNEIYFTPSIQSWSEYDNDGSTDGIQGYPVTISW